MKKNFEDAGFSIQVKALADFQDAYGLKGDENEESSGSEGETGSETGSEAEVDSKL